MKRALIDAVQVPETDKWHGFYRFDSREPFQIVEGRNGPIRFATEQYALDSAAHAVRNGQG